MEADRKADKEEMKTDRKTDKDFLAKLHVKQEKTDVMLAKLDAYQEKAAPIERPTRKKLRPKCDLCGQSWMIKSNRELNGSKQGRKPCEGTLGPAAWKWCPHLNPR
jgi:hypothetical protein